jgi:hypothetical protein
MGFGRHSSQDQTIAAALQLHVRKVSARLRREFQLQRTFPSKTRSSHAPLTVALVDGATYQGVRYPFTHPRLQPAESAVGTSQTLLQRVLPCFYRSKLQEVMSQEQVSRGHQQLFSFVSFSSRHFSHLVGTTGDFEVCHSSPFCGPSRATPTFIPSHRVQLSLANPL